MYLDTWDDIYVGPGKLLRAIMRYYTNSELPRELRFTWITRNANAQ